MYIQITDRCNMRCEHCCMESSPDRKRFMKRNVFEQCVTLAEDYGMSVTVGGGEPTLHPNIFDYLNILTRSYAYGDLEIQPFMVTNGKNYRKALRVFKLTQPDNDYGMYPVYAYDGSIMEYKDEPLLRVELSTDYYHDSIDYRILDLYEKAARRKDPGAGVRDVTRTLSGVKGIGRALKNGISSYKENDCACETLFIDPDGDMYSCGCRKYKLGSIWDAMEILETYDENYAHTGGREND